MQVRGALRGTGNPCKEVKGPKQSNWIAAMGVCAQDRAGRAGEKLGAHSQELLRPQVCQWDGGTCCPPSTGFACSLLPSASAQRSSFPAWISLVGGWHRHHWVQIYGPSSGYLRVSTWLCLFTVRLFLLCSDHRMPEPWRLCSPASGVSWIPARFGQRQCRRKVRELEKRETACLPASPPWAILPAAAPAFVGDLSPWAPVTQAPLICHSHLGVLVASCCKLWVILNVISLSSQLLQHLCNWLPALCSLCCKYLYWVSLFFIRSCLHKYQNFVLKTSE